MTHILVKFKTFQRNTLRALAKMCFAKVDINGKILAPWPNISGLKMQVPIHIFIYC